MINRSSYSNKRCELHKHLSLTSNNIGRTSSTWTDRQTDKRLHSSMSIKRPWKKALSGDEAPGQEWWENVTKPDICLPVLRCLHGVFQADLLNFSYVLQRAKEMIFISFQTTHHYVRPSVGLMLFSNKEKHGLGEKKDSKWHTKSNDSELRLWCDCAVLVSAGILYEYTKTSIFLPTFRVP